MRERHRCIISILCEYYKIESKDFKKLIKKKEDTYLILLILNKFRCLEEENIRQQLSIETLRKLKQKIKKAEEKILINKDFRDEYFDLEEEITEKIRKS